MDRDADAADLASTDMSAEPSSRAEGTQPAFGGGREAKLENEVAELKDRHLRLAAEFDNYRKRINRERSELSRSGPGQLCRQAAGCARRHGPAGGQ